MASSSSRFLCDQLRRPRSRVLSFVDAEHRKPRALGEAFGFARLQRKRFSSWPPVHAAVFRMKSLQHPAASGGQCHSDGLRQRAKEKERGDDEVEPIWGQLAKRGRKRCVLFDIKREKSRLGKVFASNRQRALISIDPNDDTTGGRRSAKMAPLATSNIENIELRSAGRRLRVSDGLSDEGKGGGVGAVLSGHERTLSLHDDTALFSLSIR